MANCSCVYISLLVGFKYDEAPKTVAIHLPWSDIDIELVSLMNEEDTAKAHYTGQVKISRITSHLWKH